MGPLAGYLQKQGGAAVCVACASHTTCTAKGLIKTWKTRWFYFDDVCMRHFHPCVTVPQTTCILYYFSDSNTRGMLLLSIACVTCTRPARQH